MAINERIRLSPSAHCPVDVDRPQPTPFIFASTLMQSRRVVTGPLESVERFWRNCRRTKRAERYVASWMAVERERGKRGK